MENKELAEIVADVKQSLQEFKKRRRRSSKPPSTAPGQVAADYNRLMQSYEELKEIECSRE